MRAAYLGPKASFSHQAALKIFPPPSSLGEGKGKGEEAEEVEIHGLPTFADIFEGVQSSQFEYGVIPFENSSNGSVVQALDLLADREAEYQDIGVCAEYCLPVRHYLMVKNSDCGNENGSINDSNSSSGSRIDSSDFAPQGVAEEISERLKHALKSIDKFYTHPQVWGQCSAFLSRAACRPIARQDCSSTSEAARIISTSAAGTCAAIASELAAREYGLSSVAEGIEDIGNNTTRFFVLARTDACSLRQRERASTRLAIANEEWGQERDWLHKSLVSFTIDHKSPGALAQALSAFEKYGLNLTSINTRPSRLRPWHYIFFAECEQVCQKKHGAEAMAQLISDLNRLATGCRHLGMWEDQPRPTAGVKDTILAR